MTFSPNWIRSKFRGSGTLNGSFWLRSGCGDRGPDAVGWARNGQRRSPRGFITDVSNAASWPVGVATKTELRSVISHGINDRIPASRVGLPELSVYNAAKLPLSRPTRIPGPCLPRVRLADPQMTMPALGRKPSQTNQ